jgi:hypothetical protein
MTFETSALVLAWVVIALLTLAMGGMLRQVRQLTWQLQGQPRRLRGPLIGSAFPLPRRTSNNGADEYFIFLTSPCRTCEALAPEMRASILDGVSITTLFRDERPEYDPGGSVVLDHQAALFDSLDISRTPYVVVVDPEQRVVLAQSVGSPASLRQLITSSRRRVLE